MKPITLKHMKRTNCWKPTRPVWFQKNNDGEQRVSQHCPKYCDKEGCYDEREKRIIAGKESEVWVSHCKELKKIGREVSGKFK
jgi:hypothetical protein